MNKDEAWLILKEVSASVQGNLATHQKIQQAVAVIEKIVITSPAPVSSG